MCAVGQGGGGRGRSGARPRAGADSGLFSVARVVALRWIHSTVETLYVHSRHSTYTVDTLNLTYACTDAHRPACTMPCTLQLHRAQTARHICRWTMNQSSKMNGASRWLRSKRITGTSRAEIPCAATKAFRVLRASASAAPLSSPLIVS